MRSQYRALHYSASRGKNTEYPTEYRKSVSVSFYRANVAMLRHTERGILLRQLVVCLSVRDVEVE